MAMPKHETVADHDAACSDVGRAALVVGVDDGGDCYFEAYWERDTRRFRGVSINGIA